MGISLLTVVALSSLIGLFAAGLKYCQTYYQSEKHLCLLTGLYFGTSFFNWLNLFFDVCFPQYLIITHTLWCFTVLINPVFLFLIIENCTKNVSPAIYRLFTYGVPTGAILVISITLFNNLALQPDKLSSFLSDKSLIVLLISIIGTIYVIMNLYLLCYHLKELHEQDSIFSRNQSLKNILVGINIILLLIPPVWFVYFSFNKLFLLTAGILTILLSIFHLMLSAKIILIENKPDVSWEKFYNKEKDKDIPEQNIRENPIVISNSISTIESCAILPLTKRYFNQWIKLNKPYLNPELKINQLALLYGVPVKELSTFLNREYGMNFNSYLNYWRLNEIKQLKVKYKNARLTELVPMAGFGSIISYNRAKMSLEKKKSNI